MERIRLYHIWQNMGNGTYQPWLTTIDEELAVRLCCKANAEFVYTISLGYCGTQAGSIHGSSAASRV